jgi:hypothetical protein
MKIDRLNNAMIKGIKFKQIEIPLFDKEKKDVCKGSVKRIKSGNIVYEYYEKQSKGLFIKCPNPGDIVKVYMSSSGNTYSFGEVVKVFIDNIRQKVLLKPIEKQPLHKLNYLLDEDKVKFIKDCPIIVYNKN